MATIKIFVRPLDWKDEESISVTLPSGSVGQDLRTAIVQTVVKVGVKRSEWIPIEKMGTGAVGMDGKEYIEHVVNNQHKIDEFNEKVLVFKTGMYDSLCLPLAL
jgi:hypothetical protein